MAYCQITFHLKITTFHGKLMMQSGGNLLVWYTLALLPGKHRTVNGREIFDTDQEIGWRAALYPISSAIKLGAFSDCLPCATSELWP